MTHPEINLSELTFFTRAMSHALAQVGVGACELDGAGRIEWLSDHGAGLLGLSPAAARGHRLSDLVHFDPGGAVGLWPNGASASLLPVRFVPVSPAVTFVVEDRDHEGLLTQLKLNQAAVEAAANSIVITDHLGIIEYVNPAFTRMTGYSRAEAVGQHTRLLNSGRHDQGFYRLLWATITSGSTWNGTLINRRKDGTHYEEEATITPVTIPGEQPHFIAIKRDVSRLRTLENQAERSGRLGLLGELTASVAHDLANILTPIAGAVELLLSEEPTPAKDRVEALADIAGSSKQATLMLRQLVGFAGSGQGLRAPIDTTRTLTAYAAQLLRATPRHVEFDTCIAPGLPALIVDSMQLYQVLLNLCVNAIEAMPRGGDLTLSARNAQREDKPVVEIAITDTGDGIPEEALARVFEPFFTTKAASGGTGLGLATVKRIAEAHGGCVEVKSAPGEGTVFTVCLPVG